MKDELSIQQLIALLKRKGDFYIFEKIECSHKKPPRGMFLYETRYGIEVGRRNIIGGLEEMISYSFDSNSDIDHWFKKVDYYDSRKL